MPRVQTANPAPPKEVRLVRASVNAVGVVEHFADLYAAIDQFVAAGLDVGDKDHHDLELEVNIRVVLRLHSRFPILSKYLLRSDRGAQSHARPPIQGDDQS